MFSAAELIEILHARFRRRFPLHVERPFGEFPPTWRAWFQSMAERIGAVTGAPAADYLNVMSQRTPRLPPAAVAELSRWRAFASLGRQQWEPAPRDQRGLRRFAAFVSALLHLVFAAMLLFLGFVAIGDAPMQEREAGDAIQVEFIGQGTPDEQGGAPAQGETDAQTASSSAGPTSATAASSSAASPAASVAVTPTPTSAAAEPTEPSPTATAQPLVVTQTKTPDIDFTLPAPVPQDLNLPQLQIATPELATNVAEVETFEARPSAPVQTRPLPQLTTPTVPTLRTQVAEVEVLQPLQQVPVRELPPTPVRTPQLREPTLRTATREIELRAPPAPIPATATVAAPSPAQKPSPPTAAPGHSAATGQSPVATASSTTAGRPQPNPGAGPPTGIAPAGVGPAPSARAGAAPTKVPGDDWGDSNRNVAGSRSPGTKPGLFNGDGSVRLPGGSGRAGGGLPPGTITEDFEKIDRRGTWLKRPPLDYTPTRFDKFWVPHEDLLEEWVRRGIKTVAIPIPGTSKRIECSVSLLQFGGGCWVSDPNLQDQEAIARPPPDVPFKPELQEDKGSLQRSPH